MNDHVDELLALYALGGLEAEETIQVEAHLAECPECRAEAESQKALVNLIAQSAQPVEPPGLARARVLRRTQPPPTPRPARALAGWWSRLAPLARQWAWPVLSSAAIVILLVWNLRLQDELRFMQDQLDRQFEDQQQILNDYRQQVLAVQQQLTAAQENTVRVVTAPDTREVALSGSEALPQASGRAYVDSDKQTVVIIVEHLPPLQPNQTYQVWVITAEGPQPSLVFAVNEKGWALTTVEVPVEYVDFYGLGISVEPAGGSETPTEVVMAGNL
jgi:anti-sigma-K factor RskA